MHSFYLDAIRNFEGYTPQAKWDYAQLSNGYGTKARFAGEVIDRVEAERRFQSEVSAARSIVEKAAPHVDEGTKAALTSLTYNAGTAWIESGLGDAVRRGDLEAARDIFQQYNKAGGSTLPGLVNRRSQEALWIGNPEALAAGGISTAMAGASGDGASLPPVVVEGDHNALRLAEMLQASPAHTSVVGQGRSAPPQQVFERGPRAERIALSGVLGSIPNEALRSLVGGEGLGPGGTAEVARLAQLGRGSELASERADKETRRV